MEVMGALCMRRVRRLLKGEDRLMSKKSTCYYRYLMNFAHGETRDHDGDLRVAIFRSITLMSL